MIAYDDWKKLEREVTKLIKKCERSQNHRVDVGILEDRVYAKTGSLASHPKEFEEWMDGPGSQIIRGTDNDITLGEVAHMHEFGIGVPERSFIRKSFHSFGAVVARRAFDKEMDRQFAKSVTDTKWIKKLDFRKAYRMAGWALVDHVQDTLEFHITPPLVDPNRDGRTPNGDPLIDTGQLFDSINFRVVNFMFAARPIIFGDMRDYG